MSAPEVSIVRRAIARALEVAYEGLSIKGHRRYANDRLRPTIERLRGVR